MKKTVVLLLMMLIWFFSLGATNHIYVTSAGAGAKDGTSWDDAMGRAEWETDLEAPCSADDTYWLESGTYTLSEDLDMTAIDGTAAAPITIIGVVGAEAADAEPPTAQYYATGADRPNIVCAGNQFGKGDYWVVKNLYFTTDHALGVQWSSYCFVDKVTVVGTGARAIFGSGTYNTFIDCNAKSTTGPAFDIAGYNKMIACYAYDSVEGINCAGSLLDIIGCKIDTCETGIDIASRDNILILNTTIWDCTQNNATGVDGTDPVGLILLSNIIDGCSKGVEIDTTPSLSNIADYNCWSNNTDDIVDTDIIWGPHKTEVDCVLNATYGTVGSGSSVLDAGLQITSISGADDKVNIGADQDDNAGGGNPPVGPTVVK